VSFFVKRAHVNGFPTHVLFETRLVIDDNYAKTDETPRAVGQGPTELDAAIALGQEVQAMYTACANNIIEADHERKNGSGGGRAADGIAGSFVLPKVPPKSDDGSGGN